jgi:RTX calcium-binding nonapeptide repeat (4 copies)
MRWGAGTLIGGMLMLAVATTPAGAAMARAGDEGFFAFADFRETEPEPNQVRVRVTPRGDRVSFRDLASPIVPARKCDDVPGVSFRADCVLDRRFGLEVFVSTGEGDDKITSEARDRYFGGILSFVTLLAGPGEDRVLGGRASEFILPGSGDDLVEAGGGDDLMFAESEGDGADTYDGGAADGDVSYGLRETRTYADFDGVADDGAEGEGDNLINIHGVTGGRAADTLIGDDIENELIGLRGPDQLEGAGGEDFLVGGKGGDEINAGPGQDFVFDFGEPGADVIDCGYGRDFAFADEGDDVRGCERVFGPSGPIFRDAKRDLLKRGFTLAGEGALERRKAAFAR